MGCRAWCGADRRHLRRVGTVEEVVQLAHLVLEVDDRSLTLRLQQTAQLRDTRVEAPRDGVQTFYRFVGKCPEVGSLTFQRRLALGELPSGPAQLLLGCPELRPQLVDLPELFLARAVAGHALLDDAPDRLVEAELRAGLLVEAAALGVERRLHPADRLALLRDGRVDTASRGDRVVEPAGLVRERALRGAYLVARLGDLLQKVLHG